MWYSGIDSTANMEWDSIAGSSSTATGAAASICPPPLPRCAALCHAHYIRACLVDALFVYCSNQNMLCLYVISNNYSVCYIQVQPTFLHNNTIIEYIYINSANGAHTLNGRFGSMPYS